MYLSKSLISQSNHPYLFSYYSKSAYFYFHYYCLVVFLGLFKNKQDKYSNPKLKSRALPWPSKLINFNHKKPTAVIKSLLNQKQPFELKKLPLYSKTSNLISKTLTTIDLLKFWPKSLKIKSPKTLTFSHQTPQIASRSRI